MEKFGIPIQAIFNHLKEIGKPTNHLNKQIVNIARSSTSKRPHVTLSKQDKQKQRSSPKDNHTYQPKSNIFDTHANCKQPAVHPIKRANNAKIFYQPPCPIAIDLVSRNNDSKIDDHNQHNNTDTVNREIGLYMIS